MKLTNNKIYQILAENIVFYFERFVKKIDHGDGLKPTNHAKIIKDGDYLGFWNRTKKRIINKSGNFKKFRNEGEQQNIDFEKYHCVSESESNVLESDINCLMTLKDNTSKEIVKILKHFGIIKDGKALIDTNYTAIGSGTKKGGNSQKKVADFTHNYGILPKGTVPTGKTWNQHYYSGDTWINGNKLDKKDLDQGKKILEYLDFQYEWVYPHQTEEYRKYGDIQSSCRMPSPIKDGIYQKTDLQKNHAIKRDNTTKEYEDVFDSYKPFDKKFAKDYKFGYGMLFTIHLIKPLENKWEALLNQGKKYLARPHAHGEWYKITPDGLKYVANMKDIAKDMAKDISTSPESVKMAIKLLESYDKIHYVNEEDYKKLK